MNDHMKTALICGFRDTISIIAWVAIVIILVRSCSKDREETSLIKAEDFTEQCRHYHYGDDRIRECMDKFLIKK